VTRQIAHRLAVAAALVVAASCSGDGDPGSSLAATAPAAVTQAEERAVTIRTTGCGDASVTTGSGVVIGQANVITAAHVVVGATDVFVEGVDEPAAVFLLDKSRDLALIKAPGVDAEPVELVEVREGDEVWVVGAATSGTVGATVARRLVMDVDDVRATSSSERSGYELDAAIAGGDSGAGVFDADGRLAGIVFAVPSERTSASFAVDATEIEAVLASTGHAEHRCDPATSQLVAPT